MTSRRGSETENENIDDFLREQEESFRRGDSYGGNDLEDDIIGGDGDCSFEDDTALTEDIRKMAMALAPQMSELEDVLKDFSEAETADALDEVMHSHANLSDISRSLLEEEDDDLDVEVEKLAISEQALREELEFAAGISMLGTPIRLDENHNLDVDASKSDLPPPTNLDAQLAEPESPKVSPVEYSDSTPRSTYILKEHANYLQLKMERMGKWYYCDMTQKLFPSVLSASASASVDTTEDLVKDYCLPIPFRKLKRLYAGLVFHDVWEGRRLREMKRGQPSTGTPVTTSGKTPLNRFLLRTASTSSNIGTGGASTAPGTNTTNAQKPARTQLKQISKKSIDNKNTNIEEPLPVRTIAIRVRPDVLCGAIMDAAHNAFEILSSNCTTHIIKRQGAHLRGAVYLPEDQLAYVVDVQLCTQKSDCLERRLLLRFYHIQDDPDALMELGQILQRKQQQETKAQSSPSQNSSTAASTSTTVSVSSSSAGDNDNTKMMGRHLRQTCSLIQRLMAAEKQEGGVDKMDPKQQASWLGLGDASLDSESSTQSIIGSHLESNFKSCPSVREENKKALATIRRLTLPSLSKNDWPVVEVAWTLTIHIVEELDTRDCSYNTLATLPFGQFPCLPTLDVQYCSQLRRLSRENMITQLLKSAKELEEYAGRAEYKCAVCITLLDPMMERYEVPPLSLPKPKALDQYPLDYTPPQAICPPWGGLVSEALNKIAAKTPTGEIDVKDAVVLAFRAFSKQDDEEQGARLGRKNTQIMERLANMQSHQRSLVHKIGKSRDHSDRATESASMFMKYCEEALNKGNEGYPSPLQKEVPLLEIKISLGASQYGRCYITSKNILFVTSFIPLLGSTRSMAFDLNLIQFHVDETVTSTLMNPFPNTMDVVLRSSKEVVFSFRPAIGPARLNTFIAIIQGFASEDKPSEYSQVLDDDDEDISKLTEKQAEEEPEVSV
eukprot:CAMPEP_0172361854 /NCGR_PEP_ID=MMETSP1060-20121228/5621_1 /TAXON_ID=37318 /ORGANISM="Pseudo-nitzschia pungens, Strain cf. cingulata" /LENGTH=952 /DNA_ID=CAMNT_0013084239 /DNA_START=178 /DNA_END=3036 /DNA_ORIENTATION=-